MDTPHDTRRRLLAFGHRRAVLCGLTALAGASTAPAQNAAKLGAIRPAPANGSAVARGGAPEPFVPPPGATSTGKYKPSIFETFEDRRSAQGGLPAAFPPPADMSQVALVAPAKPKTAIDNTWNDMVNFLNGKPEAPMPNSAAPVPQGYTAPVQQGFAPPPMYAGPPAYRWYGWGTTTPGANPLAPHGHYPQASANWYAHSGATPGAFPVPPVNPFRPPPGNEPPQYLAGGPPAPLETSPVSIRSAEVPVRTIVRQPDPMSGAGNAPVMFGYPPGTFPVPTTPGLPSDMMPIAQTPEAHGFVPSVTGEPPPPGFFPGIPVQPGAPTMTAPPTPGAPVFAPDLQWQPVSGPITDGMPTDIPFSKNAPIAATGIVQAVAVEPADLERQVAVACRGLAQSVSIKPTGPGKLTVRLVSASEAQARRAAEEISKLPALRGHEVAFEAKFGR